MYVILLLIVTLSSTYFLDMGMPITNINLCYSNFTRYIKYIKIYTQQNTKILNIQFDELDMCAHPHNH